MEYIIGKIVEIFDDSIILESNNIGYKIFFSNSNIFKKNEIVKIYLYEKKSFINSNIFSKIYGFNSSLEKELFKKIISINGIGPKNAINILKINIDELIFNIKNLNYDFFILENKISKKVTEVLLKNIRIDDLFLENIELVDNKLKLKNELTSSLEYLGFSKKEIKNIILDINWDQPIETLIKKSIDKIILNRNL